VHAVRVCVCVCLFVCVGQVMGWPLLLQKGSLAAVSVHDQVVCMTCMYVSMCARLVAG